MKISISNRVLSFLLLESREKNSDIVLKYLSEEYNEVIIPGLAYDSLKQKIDRHFIPTFMKKLKESMYSKDRFLKKNVKWLDICFNFSWQPVVQKNPKPYADLSESTKKRKIDEIFEYVPPADLLNACKKNLRFSGENVCNQKSASENNSTEPVTMFSPDEALALFLDAKLTKAQYTVLRNALLSKNIKVLPEYRHVATAKSSCCPDFKVSETSASTELQDILDHTAQRILKIDQVEKSVLENNKTKLELIVKYGCDGTSGFTQYKQAFTEARSGEGNSVFVICMVPLFLRFSEHRNEEITFWENKYPSSTKLCRPIRFIFEKETSELIKCEMSNIQKQARKLAPVRIVVEGREIFVNFTLHSTMLDGKVRQVLTDTVSSQRCSICAATPTEMNQIELVLKKPPKTHAYLFGLSTLHAWIRNMEWVLHLSYKVLANVKKYNERLTIEEKARIRDKKNNVIDGIKKELNILVDTVKQSAGNTNDGNTARKFFRNYSKVAEITGIKEEFIKRLYVILQTVGSKHYINVDLFRKYCLDTARLYIDSYQWYPMPSSCHALLIHGPAVIDAFSIPIGLLSEEAQEGRNKDFKNCRENNTRKSKPELTNEDIMRYLLVSSDPYI